MRQAIPRNNFSSGIISQQLSGRIDLPAFSNGLKNLENFDINLNGSLSKRTGYEIVGKNEEEGNSYFLKFVFNQEQVYLLEFKKETNNNTSKFCVWITTANNRVELYRENGTTKYFSCPYRFEDLPLIKTTQNFDVIYFCHNDYVPKTLTRTYNSTNKTITFTFADVVFDTATGTENPIAIDGNPSCCCFYQQRLVYGGFKKQINKIWASDKGYYNRFTTNRESHEDIIDIDGFNFVLSELKLKILWLKETTVGLVLGSSQGIAILKTESGQLTPFNFGCNLVSKDGSSPKEPIVVGTTLLYTDSTLKRIKALTYSWDLNAFVSVNLNILCPELIQEPIKKICYQEDSKDFVYVLTEEGNLYYLLYSSSEMFYAWGRINTYDDIEYIEALEKYDSGTNLFLIDSNNNILRKSSEIILKSEEEYYTAVSNNREVHNLYYNYLKKVINDFNYLDYSSQINYFHNEPLTFTKTEETEYGIFGIIRATDNIFTENAETLKTYLLEDRDNLTLFEIRDKNSNRELQVRVLSDNNFSNQIVNWSYNKNLLDNIDTNLYPNNSKWTIVGDGFYFTDMEIINGKIQLPQGINIGCFRIGHNYTSYLKTMNLGGMIDSYNTMIAKKNILKVYVRLYNSWGGKFGTDYFDLKEINYLTLENARFNEPYTLQEMDVRIDITDKWEHNKNYYLVQDVPYPFNINSITILTDYNQ